MTHKITQTPTPEALQAECRCGASFLSTGRDQSSRQARAEWMRRHIEENR